MSHSVFRDFDDEKLNETATKNEIADQNVIVFINKDGGVTVDQSALQDLIVNANTEKKTTVSVIRLGSPTPSMESEKSVLSDADDAGENTDASHESEQEVSEESSGGSDDDDSVATKSTSKRKKQKKKKNKNTIPSISLTVENFYNPEQAVVLAEEIMSIAGITNPKQLKADCEFLRYVIENDHCYTPLTGADVPGETTSATTSTPTAGKVAQSAKKVAGGRQAQASNKSNRTSSTDKESASDRLRSCDDANSSIENSGERSSEAEEEQSESDYSDFSVSESDNDRDSDLDFSVNDLHSRRTRKKRNKRIATKQAKKLTKKQQRETVENTPDAIASEDTSTPTNRKRANSKLPKKQLNAKASPSTPATTPRPVGRPVAAKKESIDEAASPAVAVRPLTRTLPRQEEAVNNDAAETANKAKPVFVVAKAKEKKTIDALFTDMSSLFSTPDIIKKVVDSDGPRAKSSGVYVTALGSDQSRKVPQPQPQQQMRYSVRNVKLASEQDKQLELIDSLVQEELSKDSTSSSKSSSLIAVKAPVDSQSHIPNIVKMLETPPPVSAKSDVTFIANTFAGISHVIDSVVHSFVGGESEEAKMQKKTSEEEKQLLDADDLLDGFANSDDCLTEDLMQHVAQLVEDKTLQEVIDQQVLGLDTPAATSTITSPQSKVGIGTMRSPKASGAGIVNTKTPVFNDRTPKANAIPITSSTPINPNKEPIKIVRSDGRVITLPPIEAPTTRGAKRRAENPAVTNQQQQKQRILLNSLMDTTPVADASANTIATLDKSGNIIAITDGGGSDKTSHLSKERRASVSVAKRAASIDTPKRKMSVSLPITAPISVDDDDDYDDDDGSDGSYNSEDDPLRLWCICRQPHNNRFMICCDKCEDWFHGKCVSITKQMGTEMEQRGAEWVCPNCIKKQQPSIKNIFPRKSSSFDNSKSNKNEAATSAVVVGNEQQLAPAALDCMVCKKPARENSIYCSNDCILKHASKTTPSQTTSSDSLKSVSAEPKQPLKSPPLLPPPRILNALPAAKAKPSELLFYDKRVSKYIRMSPAPSTERLQKWLKEHPHCELVRPNSAQWIAWKAKRTQLKNVAKGLEAEREATAMNQPPAKVQTTLRFDAEKKIVLVNPLGKQSPVNTKKSASTANTTTTKAPQTSRFKRPADAATTATATPKKRTDDPKSTSKGGSNSGESIRNSVRKTLCEQLVVRTRATDNATIAKKLSDDEITEFVTATEAALFKMFGDTNNKYRAKYRSLIFNIKDRKNETLFAKISNQAIQPEQLVRMSPEELASQELAKWRENENKHQLEMITKSELDMLACAKSYVLKTHKGEEVIETSAERVVLDPSIGAADVVSVLNSSTVSSTSEAFDAIEATSTATEKATHLIVKDNRYDKYLGASDGKSSAKKSSERSKSRDRHDSSRSSSKHKRKRSRERSHRDRDRDEKRHKSRDRGRSRDHDRKERSTSDSKRDKYKSSSGGGSGSKSKHHDSDKDRKREKETDRSIPPPPVIKPPKTESDLSVKIDEAQSIIDRIVQNPVEELKQPPKVEVKEEPSMNASATSEAAPNAKKSQVNAANESDQEPTSTVTIPTPPEYAAEPASNDALPILWSGSISMIDVATFDISLSAIDGDPTHLIFPNELDVVGRIMPETVYDYIGKIKLTKEIVLLRFSPTTEDDETAYMAFMHYLEQRRRLGVLQTKCRAIKDFYILPLPAHKSLPSVLLPTDTRTIDLGVNRGDLLIGIVVKTRPTVAPNRRSGVPNKVPKQIPTTASALPFSGIKISNSRTSTNIPLLKPTDPDDHYTPPSSPKAAQKSTKAILQSTFSMDIEDGDEPYSPEDSDDGDPSHLLSALKNTVPPTPAAPSVDQDKIKREMEELNRQIEAEKMEIALLHTADIDEPYSPSNSVSPTMPIDAQSSNNIPALANISIPANLADILKSIKSTTSASTVPPLASSNYDPNTIIVGSSARVAANYTTISGHITNEYVPPSTVPAFADLLGASTSEYTTTSSIKNEPSKLAQLTDEELLRLVPDDSLIDIGVVAPQSSKKFKYDLEPAPPGIDDDEEYCP